MKSKLIRAFALAFYYGIAQYLPDSYQPLMGGEVIGLELFA